MSCMAEARGPANWRRPWGGAVGDAREVLEAVAHAGFAGAPGATSRPGPSERVVGSSNAAPGSPTTEEWIVCRIACPERRLTPRRRSQVVVPVPRGPMREPPDLS